MSVHSIDSEAFKLQEATIAAARQQQPDGHLQGGGGGGTSGGMTVPIKDYVDARDDAVESRLVAKLDKLATKATVWGAVGTVLGILLAVAAFGSSRFDSGMSGRAMVEQVQVGQRETDARQDQKLGAIDKKIDELLKRTSPVK